ncbi:MAG: hypothetical protein ACRD0K_01915 [Egibacteraceae bacterium]
MSAHAVDTLKRLVEESRGQVPEDIAEELQARLDLLSRCVGSGMATAFEEDRSANPREALELLFELMDRPLLEWPRMLREHPELLGDDAERALDDLIATARADGKASVAAKLEELGTFLRQYRERWAPSPRGEEPAEQDREVSPLASAVSQFLRADSPQASQRVIEEHPELLTEAADQILRYLEAETEQHEDAAGAATLKAQRQLLRLCREVGIARAFEEIRRPSGWRSAGDVEAGIRTALERMDRLGAPEEDKLALRVNAASGFMVRHHATGARDDLDAAIRARHDVVRFAPVDSPDYPHHLNNLGVALAVRYALTNQLKDLEAAVEAHRGAVAACPPGFEDLPGLMTNLGNMLIDRHAHIGNRADLDEAIAVYRSAVEQAGEEADNLSGLLGNLAEGLRKRFTLE